jgi:hypothetical protein
MSARYRLIAGSKRYFGVVWPESRSGEAIALAGHEHDGKVMRRNRLIGFALDYYPGERPGYVRALSLLGDSVIGDFLTRAEAEAAVVMKLKAAQQ